MSSESPDPLQRQLDELLANLPAGGSATAGTSRGSNLPTPDLPAHDDSTADDAKEASALDQPDDYWHESRRPLASLCFSLPWLLIYEIGVWFRPPGELRNAADVWLRNWLGMIGLGNYYWLLPILVVVILLAWQHVSGQPWRISHGVLPLMFVESCFLAVCLWGIARSRQWWYPLQILAGQFPLIWGNWFLDTVQGFVDYAGAGVYEEFLFRLLLLPLTVAILGLVGLQEPQKRWWVAIIITSLLFAAAHHVGGQEPWALWPFVFRTVAGLFFSILFLYRGYGIATGTHALYDILVGILLKS
ncbi:MAG: CPBP family intramembrane glutamic endopeptidase [Pirellulales bacterium]|nr:CPBP family intramembrane glutamic endopeptidase [Pirellulales bacterium]